jgi:electron transfer flavoprotein alpha subunit
MPGIYVFSEDAALAKQLLTPALELKQSLSQPVTVFSLSETDAKDLAALGADKVIAIQAANGWTEGLSEAIAGMLCTAGASVFLVGGTLRGKHIAAFAAAKLNAGMSTDAKAVKIEGGKLVATRLLYAGLALCDEEASLPAVVTIPPRSFAPPAAAATRCQTPCKGHQRPQGRAGYPGDSVSLPAHRRGAVHPSGGYLQA